MKASLTEILNLSGNLFGYVFWLGGTLLILKRAFEMHRKVDNEPADSLRVPHWIGWLLTGKRGVTKVSLIAIGGQVVAILWFTLSAMAGKYILNRWMYYVFWFSGALIIIWSVVFLAHHLMWWYRHR